MAATALVRSNFKNRYFYLVIGKNTYISFLDRTRGEHVPTQSFFASRDTRCHSRPSSPQRGPYAEAPRARFRQTPLRSRKSLSGPGGGLPQVDDCHRRTSSDNGDADSATLVWLRRRSENAQCQGRSAARPLFAMAHRQPGRLINISFANSRVP